MRRLLHLTDLHLGTPDDHVGADFKSDTVPIKDRPDRFTAIQSTLKAIATSDWRIDGIVITGDISFKNASEGWRKFDTLLDPLKDAGKLPGPGQIVVTPGNHDVEWGRPAGDSEHYSEFIRHVRDRGYVTPALEGIDLNDEGQIVGRGPHHMLDVPGRLAVVPVNSSHYCGALESLETPLDDDEWAEVVAKVREWDSGVGDQIQAQVNKLREQDIARISEPQFKALESTVRMIKRETTDQGVDPESVVLLAAVHHHLLPIGTDEEFKSYESMTNLGRFRQLLVDLGFHGVAHGHKHSGGVFWDRVHRKDASLLDPDPRLLVISGSTAGSASEGVNEVARFVDVDPCPTSRSITISKVPVVDHGGRIPEDLHVERAELWRSEMKVEPRRSQVISGEDAPCVYERLMSLFEGKSDEFVVANLVCEVRFPGGVKSPPAGYPVERVPGGRAEAEAWFRETVDWWQKKQSSLQFTHGQRLRAWGTEGGVDQIGEAIRLLQNDANSSRAVVTLIDPTTDKLASPDCKFPSFSLAQFMIRDPREGPRTLECFGMFRKQEMRYWWPINVAELARLQAHVHERLQQPDLELGAIVTYASIAHVGSEVPDVNVSLIDRFADNHEDEDRLWRMAYAVAHPGSVDGEAARYDWDRVLADLRPVEGEDHPPRSELGVAQLREQLGKFAESASVNGVVEQLACLENAYDAMEKEAGEASHWRQKIGGALDALAVEMNRLFPSDPDERIRERSFNQGTQ